MLTLLIFALMLIAVISLYCYFDHNHPYPFWWAYIMASAVCIGASACLTGYAISKPAIIINKTQPTEVLMEYCLNGYSMDHNGTRYRVACLPIGDAK